MSMHRQIAAMMRAPTPPIGGIITTGLRARWLFEEGSGTTTADSVGTNDGTLQGGATWETASPLEGVSSLKLSGHDSSNVRIYEDYGTFDDFAITCYIDFAEVRLYSTPFCYRSGFNILIFSNGINEGLYKMYVYLGDGDDYNSFGSVDDVATAGEHRYGVRRIKGGDVHFYRDGVEYAAEITAGDNTISVSPGAIGYIGRDPVEPYRNLYGDVDDMRLYIDSGSGIPTRAEMLEITNGTG